MKKIINSCVQCGSPLKEWGTPHDELLEPVYELVCHNPGCANYGIVQLGIENMAALDKLMHKIKNSPNKE